MFFQTASSTLESLFKKIPIFCISAMNEEFAIAGKSVQKMIPYEQIHFLAERVIQSGNEIIPIFDIRAHPDDQHCISDRSGQLLILSIGNKSIGVLVNQVIDQLKMDPLSVKDVDDAELKEKHVQGKIAVKGQEMLLIDLVELLMPKLSPQFINSCKKPLPPSRLPLNMMRG